MTLRRALIGGAFAALLLTALGSAVLGALLGTETGSRWLIDTAARASGASLAVGRFSGSVLGGLRLDRLRLSSGRWHLTAGHVVFEWRPGALLEGSLHIVRLELADVRLAGPPAASDRSFRLPRWPALPIAVRIDQARITDLVLRRGSETRRIDRLELRSRLASDGIVRIEALRVHTPEFTFEAAGRIASLPAPALALQTRWSARTARLGTLRGSGSLEGPWARIAVRQHLSAPFTALLDGHVDLAARQPRVALRLEWKALSVPGSAWRSPRGTLSLEGDERAFTLALSAAAGDGATDLRHLELAARGGLKTSAASRFAVHWRWSASLEAAGHALGLAGRGEAEGDAARIAFTHVLSAPFVVTTRGTLRPGDPAHLIDARGTWQALRWPLEGSPAFRSAEGRYAVSGSAHSLRVDAEALLGARALPVRHLSAQLEATIEPSTPLRFDAQLAWKGELPAGSGAAPAAPVAGTLRARGTPKEVRFEQHLSAPFQLQTRGVVTLADARPRATLTGDWSGIRWPLHGAPAYRSPKGSFRLTGSPSTWKLGFSAQLTGRSLPRTALEGTLAGGRKGVSLEPVRARLLGGEALLRGRIAWDRATQWDLRLRAQGLDPGRYWPAWAGRLEGGARIRGRRADGLTRMQIENLALEGRLRGYPVRVHGNAELAGAAVPRLALTLRSGRARASLEGSVTQRMALRYRLEAPTLAALWPGLRGSATASGRVRGARARPTVDLSLDAHRVAWRDDEAATVALSAHVELARWTASSARLSLADAKLSGTAVSNALFTVRGAAERLEAALEARTARGDLRAEASAHPADGGVDIVLSTLHYRPPVGGPWSLQHAARIRYAKGATRLTRACVADGRAHLCVQGTRDRAGRLAGELGLEALPLDLADPWLPGALHLEGTLGGRATLTGGGDGTRIEVAMDAPPGRIVYRGTNHPIPPIVYGGAKLRVQFDPRGGTASLEVDLGATGRIAASLRAGPGKVFAERTLSGSIDASLHDLSLIEHLDPRLTAVKGKLQVQAALSGRLGEPRIEGAATLSQGALEVPAIGIALTGIEVRAQSRAQGRVTIRGQAQSGGGTLRVDGTVTVGAPTGWSVELALTGRAVQVVRLPEATVYASPDLKVAYSHRGAAVRGRITLPKARIALRRIPGNAVSVSPDQVLVGTNRKPAPPPGAFPVESDITVELGDDVRFSGFGLQTGLAGSIHIIGKPHAAPLGEGVVNLVGATFTAFGQPLSVDTGRFVFAGPVDNPGINLVASRTVQNTSLQNTSPATAGSTSTSPTTVTAGVRVTGTVNQPEIQVFSQPPLPQADALSYLLTGHSIQAGGGADAALLAQAALSHGLGGGGESFTQELANRLGLSQLSVGSAGGSGKGGSLVLGKYLTPDLYVRYALGLFGATGGLQVRYKLSRHLSVQAESGVSNQGVDLLYNYEH